MINLLPPLEKRNLKKAKNIKIVLILAMGLLYFLICFVLILFSIKFYIQGEVESDKFFLEESQDRYEFLKTQDIENNIKNINKDIILINNFYKNKNYSSVFLKEISEIIPDGIYINNIAFNSYIKPKSVKGKDVKKNEQKYSFKVSLTGIADTREDLFNFKQILEKQGGFIELYIPSSNWTKPSDVNFSLKFKVK